MINNIIVLFHRDSDHDNEIVAKLLRGLAEDSAVWAGFPGVFAFSSPLNVDKVQDELTKRNLKNFLVLNFAGDQVDGSLDDEDWRIWTSEVFFKDLPGLLIFHGEKDLTAEDFVKGSKKV